jgi:hypothetical protein
MTGDLDQLRQLAVSGDPFFIEMGVPERLGDKCFGIGVGDERIALVEPDELPILIAALPESPLKRSLARIIP